MVEQVKIGLVGGSYKERSLPYDAQRSINLYPVMDGEGKETSALYATPGHVLFGDTGVVGKGSRECFTCANGRVFFVVENGLYEVDSSGTPSHMGTLNTSAGNVSMDENGTQLAICDGQSLYIFTYSDNSFAQVTDPDLPLCSTVTYLDGYFIVSAKDGEAFYYSALRDGENWNALDFASAESSPDKLQRVFRGMGQLWLFGDKTTEVWTNIGASDFPWQKYAGSDIETGIYAPHSLVRADNTLLWIGQDDKGAGIVYKAQGFAPNRISTHAIEQAIARANSPRDIKGFSYQEDGHTFYILTGGGLETSLCLDLSTGYWHERARLPVAGATTYNYGGAKFNGSANYLDTNPLTGITDTKKGTLFAVVRFANAASGVEYLIHSTGNNFRVWRTATGDISVWGENSGGSTIMSFSTATKPCASAGTYVIMASWDLATPGSGKLYVNGVSDYSESTFTDDTIDYTLTEVSIGGASNGSALLTGDFYMLWFTEKYALDFSDVDVRSVFADASNVAQFLGGNGEIPTGTTPILFLAYDSGSDWCVNKGSATSSFTLNGTFSAPDTEYNGANDDFFDPYANEIATGILETHIASCCTFGFGKILIGSRRDGKIYHMSMDYYDHDGDEMVTERVYTHISNENERITTNRLEIGFESGVGLQSGQGSNPVAELWVSKDGARTWIYCGQSSIGAVGNYGTRATWRRFGVAHQLTFRVRVSDPVKRAITGSYLS